MTRADAIQAECDATDEEIGRLQERLSKLQDYRDWLARGVALAEGIEAEPAPALPPATSPPPESPAPDPPADEPAAPKPAPKRAAPAARHTGTRRKQAVPSKETEAVRARVHDFIREHGPVSRKQICVELDLDPASFKSVMAGLRGKGITQIGKRGGAKYVAKHGSITPATGPKTEAERRIFDALADQPLTSAGISVKVNRPVAEVSTMAESMVRRDVLRRLNGDGEAVRYERVQAA